MFLDIRPTDNPRKPPGQKHHVAARSNVSPAARLEGWPMAEEQFDESRLQALIKMEVACRLALESLPELPRETESALREPIDTLCTITPRR